MRSVNTKIQLNITHKHPCIRIYAFVKHFIILNPESILERIIRIALVKIKKNIYSSNLKIFRYKF